MRVAVSISKGAVGFFVFALFLLVGGAFGLGVYVGLRVEREPVVVERVVDREVPKPVAVGTESRPQPSATEVASAPIVVKEDPKPKLEVTIGAPEDTNAWSVQIGAFP